MRRFGIAFLAAIVSTGLFPPPGAGKPPPHKVYAHFAEPYQFKPRTLYIGNYAIEELEWSRWNYSITTGAGIFPYNNCKPYCAAGHITRYETTVTLGRPVRCPGKSAYIYTRLRYTLPPSAPNGGAAFTMSCSGRYKGFHQL
jgi:hypothetical protein